MATNLQTASPSALRGNYVLLRADTLRLLLPQHEVGAAEYLEGALQPSETAGLLRLDSGGQGRPFVALSKQMLPLQHCPADRFVVATLNGGDDDLGWCWNEIKVLIDSELQLRPLPSVMVAPHTPVDHFVEQDGEIAYVCTAERLRTYALTRRS